jgi:CubicO group peptidase (beta-lactamase class C family)
MTHERSRRCAALGLAAAIALGACTSDESEAASTTSTAAATTTVPPQPSPADGEWPTADPAALGLDPVVVQQLADEAAADGSNCFLVVRDGQIAGEWYWNGTGPDTAQEVFSATKSVTSVLVGIAADDGDLAVEDPAATWIPEWSDTRAEEVAVRNLLSNDSGRQWSFQSDYPGLLQASDRTAYGIGLEQADPPGEVWAYNNSAIQTLEQVLEGSTGDAVSQFARERLLEPIGMAHSAMTTDPAGNTLTFMGLQSTCRDMARFGWLILEHGRWGDDQVVSEDWIDESTGRPSQDLNAAYGYLWWLNRRGPMASTASATRLEEEAGAADGQRVPGAPEDLVWALGLGGQIVQIHEPTRTVVVRLGPATLSSPYGPDKPARLVTDGLTED